MKRLSVIGLRGFPGIQGGVERHCEKLIPLLAEEMECTVYRRKSYVNDGHHNQYHNIGFKDLPSTRVKGFESAFHSFLATIHAISRRPDYANVHNIGPGMYIPLLKLFGIKTVLTYHSPNYEHSKWGRMSKLLLKACESISLRFADKIIFVNRFQMEKYNQRVRNKSVFIPNGVEPACMTGDTGFLEKFGIKRGRYVLCVGRITPEKGFDHIIDAVNRIDDIEQLVIAGGSDHDNSYLNNLQKRNSKNKIIYTGAATGNDLAQLYSHARLFVLPSLNEGFPITLLEAMSYGLPLLISDIPGTRLVSLPEECYFTVGDTDSLADALPHAYANAHHRNYDLSRFDWRNIAEETIKIYRQLSS